MPTLKPTDQQQNFLDLLTNNVPSPDLSHRHLALIARAGTGKTSSIMMGVDAYTSLYPSHQIAVVAYNTDIAKELEERLVGAGYDWRQAQAGTVHRFGRRLLNYTFRPEVEEKKVWKLIDAKRENLPRTSPFWAYGSQIQQLVSLGKQAGVGFFDHLHIEDRSAWYQIADHFDIAGFDSSVNIDEVVTGSIAIYKQSLEITDMIDFDDMILMPLVYGAKVKYPFDLVFVDERQDLSAARHALVKKLLKPDTGRMVIVGDPRQSIYGFCHTPETQVLTPQGLKEIKDVKTGDAVIISSTHGEIEGWQTPKKVLATHEYDHDGPMIQLYTDSTGFSWQRSVNLTPNHRVPVRVDPNAKYYTYLMRRCGVYRVGYCQAWTSGQFMLQCRKKTEGADAVWILTSHENKQEAREIEEKLLWRVKGRTFSLMSDEQVKLLPTEETEAHEVLSDYGRLPDFPLIGGTSSVRISQKGAFVTESCNIMPGMLVAFYDEVQTDARRRGRNRQSFVWTPVQIDTFHYTGKVYGLTVEKTATRRFGKYTYEGLPLYFAGHGVSRILVHNSGAETRGMEDCIEEMNMVSCPLSVTWRCARAIVEKAQTIVPDLEAAPTAAEGEVLSQPVLLSSADYEQTYGPAPSTTIMLDDLQPGKDAILCRNNAPLAPLAYKLIRAGVPAKILGRKIGEGLITLCERWDVRKTEALVNKLLDYRERETSKLKLKGADAKAEEVGDRVGTLLEIVQEVNRRGHYTVDAVVRFVRDLFSDETRGFVTLSTYHKSKGKEWDRVFLFEHSSRCPSRAARQAWQLEQESNLAYVAYTRAKKVLVLVG